MNEHDRRHTRSNDDHEAAPRGAPGKRTLVQRRVAGGSVPPPPPLPAELTPVQLATARAAGAAPDDPFGLHLEGSNAQAVAAGGVEGAGGALPHADAIQASFGRHDVSGIQSHVGGAAATASSALGAEAYATGNSVAFGSSPSLHTAAHEAAHVVQQRAGVSLKGGVGEAGDAYEQHADRVADAVVAGRSAEALLDAAPGGAASDGAAVQRQEAAVPEPSAVEPEIPAEGEAPVEGEKSAGDKMREAVLGGAQKRLDEKTTIVSEEKINEIRNKPADQGGMKNFTTCIEFAGQTSGDMARSVGGGDAAETKRLAMLLPNFMVNFQKESGVNAQIATFEKAAALWDKPIAEMEAKLALALTEIERLEAQGETGDKATDIRNNMLLKQQHMLKGVYENQLKILHREQDKMFAKVEKLNGELAALQEKTEAWVKPGPNFANGRPQPGEWILLGAGSSQAYGVSDATKVTLAAGSFKHIAVFKSCATATSPDGEAWEEWHTIDGGGITAKATTLFVRLSDGRAQFQTPGTAWAASNTVVLGWINMDTLVGQGLAGAAH
jgi:hypothetical protein